MPIPRTLPLIAMLVALPFAPAKANELLNCKNASGIFVTWETERGARRASDGAMAFSYAAVLRNAGPARTAWVSFNHPGADNAARRRAVQLPDDSTTTSRVPLGIVWGPQLDRSALERATEVLCYGNQ